MLPISALNALRRAAIEGLQAQADTTASAVSDGVTYEPQYPPDDRTTQIARSACMVNASQLTTAAQNYFDICYLPAEQLLALTPQAWQEFASRTELGVVLPPVIMDHERDGVASQLAKVAERGVHRALVGNVGHLSLVKQAGLIPEGDFRLNVTNSESVRVVQTLGVRTPVLSPELTLPQIRDIRGDVRTIVYGRIPMMLLEKCVIREIADCKTCDAGRAELVDRRGTVFPVLRSPDHRNVIYNSVPTYMADAKDQLTRYRTGSWHFIFSTETPREVDDVVDAYQNGKSTTRQIRRINK
jgi:hypothetical protein